LSAFFLSAFFCLVFAIVSRSPGFMTACPPPSRPQERGSGECSRPARLPGR
jgi:hypothetical protein